MEADARRDSVANDMTWLAYSARLVPKRLAMGTQPSGASAGVALTTQPTVQVVDGGGEFCSAATNTVTATKHSGVTGTLSGTTSKAAVAGTASFTDLAMSAGESGVTIDFGASGLTSVTSAPFDVAGGSSNPLFFMSTETGGGGSDATAQLTDNLARGRWYTADADHSGSPTGINTDGYWGTIFTPIVPAGAVRSDNQGVGGKQYCATHGVVTLSNDQGLMAEHALLVPNAEVRVRIMYKPKSGYSYGAQKVISFNRQNGGGIDFGNLHINLGAGGQSSTGTLQWQDPGPSERTLTLGTLVTDHWNHVEVRIKLSTTSSSGDGIFQAWLNDRGTDGTSGSAPTQVLNVTDYSFPKPGTTIGSIWIENFANPHSAGEMLWDALYVRTGASSSMIGFYPL